VLCRSQWVAEGPGPSGLPGALAHVHDRPWVVQQCLAYMAADGATQQQLLQYGLEITAHHCQPSDLAAAQQGRLQAQYLCPTLPDLCSGCLCEVHVAKQSQVLGCIMVLIASVATRLELVAVFHDMSVQFEAKLVNAVPALGNVTLADVSCALARHSGGLHAWQAVCSWCLLLAVLSVCVLCR